MELKNFTMLKEDITEPDMNAKIIIIGDTGVGKSCLVLRATKDEFKDTHEITIGAEFGSYNAKIDNTTIKLQIWDTAGQESFKSMIRVFYKGAQFAILVFDLTRFAETLSKAEDWLKEIRENTGGEIPILLVGTHLDLVESVSNEQKEKIEEFKKRNKVDAYMDASSKTGKGVHEVFKFICISLFDKNSPKSPLGTQIVGNTKDKPKKKCCN